MRLNYVGNALGLVLTVIGIVMFVPVIVALYYREWGAVAPFVTAGLISLIIGKSVGKLFCKNVDEDALNDIKKTEALIIVSLSWIMFGFVACVPYLHFGLNPIDALFEAVSGITTTGATILESFNYPKTLLFWRSFTQWLGGMGIIVLFVAILPQFAVAGRQMFFAEAPGPTEDKFTPRIKNTASALWIVYAGLTLLCCICLWLAGMQPYDSICNAMSTISAGGFSPNPQCIGGYGSNLIVWIVTVFMFLSGISFVLQSRVLTKRKLSLFWKSEEFRFYTGIIFLFSMILTSVLFFGEHFSLLRSFSSGFYHILSLATSTGSSAEDYQLWSFNSKMILFIAMFISSCSGSAGGGLKMTRWILVFKYMKNELYKILHPNAVISIKIDNKVVAPDVIKQTLFFTFCFFGIWAISAVFLTLIEDDIVIGLTSAISSLGDIGPGLGHVIGPMGNFSSLKTASKILFIINMFVGRLEIIPFLVLLNKEFWSIKKG